MFIDVEQNARCSYLFMLRPRSFIMSCHMLNRQFFRKIFRNTILSSFVYYPQETNVSTGRARCKRENYACYKVCNRSRTVTRASRQHYTYVQKTLHEAELPYSYRCFVNGLMQSKHLYCNIMIFKKRKKKTNVQTNAENRVTEDGCVKGEFVRKEGMIYSPTGIKSVSVALSSRYIASANRTLGNQNKKRHKVFLKGEIRLCQASEQMRKAKN